MKEPLTYFIEKTGFDRDEIKRFVAGSKFAGVMLKDGRTGICAVLDAVIDDSVVTGTVSPDLNNQGHRVIINAYLNALLNYSPTHEPEADLMTNVDLKKYNSIVIIGFFESMVAKMIHAGIGFRVYDRDSSIQNDLLSPLPGMDEDLAKCDALIITGSSLANNTFCPLIEKTSAGCDVYLLGPSNILHPDMFLYRNVKMVFGSVFDRFDNRVLDLIAEGHGARTFLTGRNKVCLRK
ncbi:MAG TPA: DUF364 domain-containing protein [Bacteroidales bacterium]|nr:DUF364 domain-containing protein [Bacteroidales bacterium]HRT90479.1 DUF364 domain-containing protein [Bacteroidales bacterium]